MRKTMMGLLAMGFAAMAMAAPAMADPTQPTAAPAVAKDQAATAQARQKCGVQNPNALLHVPCMLGLTEDQAKAVMKARLILGGHPDLVVSKADAEPGGLWFDLSVATASGEVISTFKMSRDTGAIDGLR